MSIKQGLSGHLYITNTEVVTGLKLTALFI